MLSARNSVTRCFRPSFSYSRERSGPCTRRGEPFGRVLAYSASFPNATTRCHSVRPARAKGQATAAPSEKPSLAGLERPFEPGESAIAGDGHHRSGLIVVISDAGPVPNNSIADVRSLHSKLKQTSAGPRF